MISPAASTNLKLFNILLPHNHCIAGCGLILHSIYGVDIKVQTLTTGETTERMVCIPTV